MDRRVALQFTTASVESATRFLEEYVLDALDRVPNTDACDSFTFVPGQPVTGDRPSGPQVPPPDYPVYLTLRCDTDAVIAAERDHWEALIEEGVIEGWEEVKSTDREEIVTELGEQRAALLARSSNLSAQMAGLASRAFADLGMVPAAVETYPDEESDAAPFGWWAVLHTVTVQLIYSMDEELDAYRYGIEHALRNVAEQVGEDEAVSRLDELIAELEGVREKVGAGRLDS